MPQLVTRLSLRAWPLLWWWYSWNRLITRPYFATHYSHYIFIDSFSFYSFQLEVYVLIESDRLKSNYRWQQQ